MRETATQEADAILQAAKSAREEARIFKQSARDEANAILQNARNTQEEAQRQASELVKNSERESSAMLAEARTRRDEIRDAERELRKRLQGVETVFRSLEEGSVIPDDPPSNRDATRARTGGACASPPSTRRPFAATWRTTSTASASCCGTTASASSKWSVTAFAIRGRRARRRSNHCGRLRVRPCRRDSVRSASTRRPARTARTCSTCQGSRSRTRRAAGGTRTYDVAIPDRDGKRTQPELWRDGELLFRWSIAGRHIVGPPPFDNVELRGGFIAWAEETLDADTAEAASILRRACDISFGRSMDLDVFETADMLGDPVRGTCHSFQPGMIEQAVRVKGQTRDFTNDADALLRSP